MNRWLGSLASGSQLTTAALAALLALRFALSSFASLMSGEDPRSQAGDDDVPVFEEDTKFGNMLGEARKKVTSHDRKEADSLVPAPRKKKPQKGPPPKGGPVRTVMLSVSVGPPRSELYVNGKRVGKTPYVGNYTCHTGTPLTLQILPEVGPVIQLEQQCNGRTISANKLPETGGADAQE